MINDTSLCDRARRSRGCLLGGAIGDAWVASTVAGGSGSPGTAVSDRTQMSLFVAEGLVRGSVRARRRGISHAPSMVHAALLRWYETQGEQYPHEGTDDGWLIRERWLWSYRSPGMTNMGALGATARLRPLQYGGHAANESKGCGSVVRSAPFGFVTRSPMETAAESSLLTHGHPTAAVAAGFLARTIELLAAAVDLGEAVDRTRSEIVERFGDSHDETTSLVERAVGLAGDGPPSATTIEKLGSGWRAEEALAISLLIALTADSWRDAFDRAANISGGCGSAGSVTANIIGTWWGDDDLDEDWLDRLEGRHTIERIATDLVSVPVLGVYDEQDYPGR